MSPESARRWASLLLTLSLSCNPQDLSRQDDSTCDPACPAGQICAAGQCVADVPCGGDADCENDSFCQDGHCLPYGTPPRGDHNDMCMRVSPAGLLSPQIGCEWSGPAAGEMFPGHKQVLSTPLVADFNFDGHLGGETPLSHPSIVINTYDSDDGACGLGAMGAGDHFGVIRVLDGRTCKQQYVIPTHVNGATTPAIGDVNGDGRPDIVSLSATGGLVALSFDPARNGFSVLWTSHTPAGAAHDPLAGTCEWTGPTLADLNDDGKPEALAEGYVYDETGKLLDGALGRLDEGKSSGQFAVVADVDHDGVPNLVSARGLWRWDRARPGWQVVATYPGVAAGFVAVADFGAVQGGKLDRGKLDGIAEIAVVSGGQAWIQALDGKRVAGPVPLPGSNGGGPPTVGDFDHDGRPEFAAAGSDSYTVFDPDCAPGGDRASCGTQRQDGILWTSVSQDHSSNVTGSAVFDFNGNGAAQAIYADECFARIYDGRSGEVLFSQEHSSCTWNEYPTLADVAGNFRSQLIVPSNTNCDVMCPSIDPVFKGLRCAGTADCPAGSRCDAGYCRCADDAQCNTAGVGGGFVCRAAPAGVAGPGKTCQAAHTSKRSGVRVFKDVLDRWVSSRPLWNQHAYAVTNINDDGRLPRTSQERRNWEQPGLNNFRMNVQGTAGPQAAPELTVKGDLACNLSGQGTLLSASVCNRGTAPAADGVPVTFYEGGVQLCTGRTPGTLYPGRCLAVSCPWSGATPGDHAITAVANDEGGRPGPVSECEGGNHRGRGTVRCDKPVE